ncbi:MAG: hypothetical protein P8K11_07965 [Gammaproteobacteria bacterium]|nr:hypothetical protein [Gammaproteobacteria bacterium]
MRCSQAGRRRAIMAFGVAGVVMQKVMSPHFPSMGTNQSLTSDKPLRSGYISCLRSWLSKPPSRRPLF